MKDIFNRYMGFFIIGNKSPITVEELYDKMCDWSLNNIPKNLPVITIKIRRWLIFWKLVYYDVEGITYCNYKLFIKHLVEKAKRKKLYRYDCYKLENVCVFDCKFTTNENRNFYKQILDIKGVTEVSNFPRGHDSKYGFRVWKGSMFDWKKDNILKNIDKLIMDTFGSNFMPKEATSNKIDNIP